MGTLFKLISSTSADRLSVSSDWSAATSIGGASSSKSISGSMVGIFEQNGGWNKCLEMTRALGSDGAELLGWGWTSRDGLRVWTRTPAIATACLSSREQEDGPSFSSEQIDKVQWLLRRVLPGCPARRPSPKTKSRPAPVSTAKRGCWELLTRPTSTLRGGSDAARELKTCRKDRRWSSSSKCVDVYTSLP
jgi:hypothetical protein